MNASFRLGWLWLGIALALAACGPSAAPVPRAARLVEISNIVEMRASANQPFAPATLGATLPAGAQIRTGAQSKARVDFNDGSIVRLSENTLLTIADVRATESGLLGRFQMELGKIWVSLFGGTFELETPVGIATVRGSYATFELLLAQPDDPESITLLFDCLEGACAAKTQAVTVNLGNLERVIVAKSAHEIVPTDAPPDALREFLLHNPSPESQRILPTLTAAPRRTRTVQPATPFRTRTPRPLPTGSPRPLPTRTPITLPIPVETRPILIRPTATPEPRTPILPLRTATLEPRTPILPLRTATLEPRTPILPRPTDPLLPQPTDPIIVRPTEPLSNVLPSRTPILNR